MKGNQTEKKLILLVEIQLRSPLTAETLQEYWVKYLDGYAAPTGYTAPLAGKLWEVDPEGYLLPSGNFNATSPVWQYDPDGYLTVKEN